MHGPDQRASGCFFEKSNDDQENHGSDDGIDDRRDDAASDDHPDHRQQPTGNNRTDDADHDISDESEAVALNDQASEPTGYCADNQPSDQRLNHDCPPQHAVQRTKTPQSREYFLRIALSAETRFCASRSSPRITPITLDLSPP